MNHLYRSDIMHQICIFICFAPLLSTIHASSKLNLTRLISLYINSCGEEGLCKKWPGLAEYPRISLLSRCPPCSCEDTCFLKNTCCPDKYFERKMSRFRHSVFQWSFINKQSRMLPLYSVIDSCPEFAKNTNKCENPSSEIEDRNFVTSLVTNYTYYNVFCATCNDERESDIVVWDTSVDLSRNYIFFMESRDELFSFIKKYRGFVIFTPPPILRNIVFPIHFDNNFFTDSCLDGSDLQIACSSSYINIFRLYKNIFCFLCKLQQLRRFQPSIDTCPKSVTKSIQKLCSYNLVSNMTYPYKNFYCFLCNIPTSYKTGENRSVHKDKYDFLDFSSIVSEQIVGEQYNRRLLIFKGYAFNNISILNKILKTVLKQDVSSDKATKYISNQMKPFLTSMADAYPHRICDRDIFSNTSQNVSMKDCDCSLSCLFKNPCSCCLDTVLMYPIGCVSNTKAIFSKEKSLEEAKIQVVKECYEGTTISRLEHREKIKHLCEGSLDEFDFPVLSNSVTYKNMFCFLCNTNYTIANGTLISEPYEIVDINIFCNNPLQFDFLMRFSEVLEEAVRSQCDIIFGSKKNILCFKDTGFTIKRRNVCKRTHANFDDHSTGNWTCEKTGSKSFFHVKKYPSEFCQLCKPFNDLDSFDKVEVCDESKIQYVKYRNACLTLPDARYEPPFQSYRNIFCSHCIGEYNVSHQYQFSESCRTVLGGIAPQSSRMMRDLFIPMVPLPAYSFKIKKSESARYGCYPGRVLEDGVCKLVIPFPRQISYHLHILCQLSVSSSMNDTALVLSQVKSLVFQNLSNSIYVEPTELRNLYILARPSNVQLHQKDVYYFEGQVTLSYNLLYYESFDRNAVENDLLQTYHALEIEHSTHGAGNISFSLKGIEFGNLSETLTSRNLIPEKDYLSFRDYYKTILINFPDNGVIVSRILTSRLHIINITGNSINFDEENYRVIVKNSNEVFYLGEFVRDYSFQLKVYIESITDRTVTTGISDTIETLTNIVNGFSIASLVFLVVIYLMIPELRTVPGLNIMSTTFSLLGMQLTYTIANVLQKETFVCTIVGVLLHYFWLCLCCCMFICCLHIFLTVKGFVISFVHGEKFNKLFVKYVLFCYLFPFTVVFVNLSLSYLIDGSIGYGIKVCFVEQYIQNIATFIVPLVSTCISNIILFTLTIKHIVESKENVTDLVVFCKFFCLTGAVWILQVIDCFFHISAFSFVVTILTSSQGIFIFIGVVFSSPVVKFFKSKKVLSGTTTDVTAVSRMQTDSIGV